jgi:hypothetical protein
MEPDKQVQAVQPATPAVPALDEEAAAQLQAVEDAYEALLLAVMACEDDWFLDDRIAFQLRKAA